MYRFVSVCAGVSAGFVVGWCAAIVIAAALWQLGLRPEVPEISVGLTNIGDIFGQISDAINAIVSFIRLVIIWFIGLPILGAVIGGAMGYKASAGC